MLHIHNGDSSANTLEQSPIPGEQLAFRESLITGPTPANVSGDDWLRLRAAHLSEAYGGARADCERELRQQQAVLSTYAAHDEIVLWFEHDLFCQTLLVYLLDWFAGRELGSTKLSLICIGEFPGIEGFRGLGQLNVDQLASLFETRHAVTGAELKLASAAWQAYGAPDPTAIEALLAQDTTALPFLRAALLAHLARFPSVRNGLGRIEERALALVDRGVVEFTELFPSFGAAEPVYGLGDFQFWLALKGMAVADRPLLVFADGQSLDDPIELTKVRETQVSITAYGMTALRGETDVVETNGIDEWLGGAHLLPEQLWRWDEPNQKLSRSNP